MSNGVMKERETCMWGCNKSKDNQEQRKKRTDEPSPTLILTRVFPQVEANMLLQMLEIRPLRLSVCS